MSSIRRSSRGASVKFVMKSSLLWSDSSNRSLKTFSDFFDMTQDERREFEIIDDFPFMLRHSKHSDCSLSRLLASL